MSDNKDLERVRWRCRRGMLELDLLLLPFFEHQFLQLNSIEKLQFLQLLDEADPDLYNWLMGAATPENNELMPIILKIRNYARNSC